jgi:hypothetical protein
LHSCNAAADRIVTRRRGSRNCHRERRRTRDRQPPTQEAVPPGS